MRNIIILHLLVVPFSVALAASWANQLLAVRKKAAAPAAVQLALDDLPGKPKPSASGGAQPQTPVTRQEETAEEASEETSAAASSQPTGEGTEESGGDESQTQSQAAAGAASEAREPISERDAASDNTVAEGVTASEGVPDAGIASFHGAGIAAAATGTMTGREAGNGPEWRVRLEPSVSLRTLQSIPHTQLVAVRLRREYTEVAPIVAGRVGEPQRLAAYLAEHGRFGGQRGLLLDRHVLDEFRDRLVAYGGGWAPWLLLEDDLYRCWCEQVRAAVEARGIAWDEAACITTQLALARADGAARLAFVLSDVKRRAAEDVAPEAP